jgi:hypothetical protein
MINNTLFIFLMLIIFVFLAYVFYVCALPPDCGFPCNGNGTTLHYHLYNESLSNQMILTLRHRYDHTKDKCVHFEYHGCGGNWNNFETDEKCIVRCGEID